MNLVLNLECEEFAEDVVSCIMHHLNKHSTSDLYQEWDRPLYPNDHSHFPNDGRLEEWQRIRWSYLHRESILLNHCEAERSLVRLLERLPDQLQNYFQRLPMILSDREFTDRCSTLRVNFLLKLRLFLRQKNIPAKTNREKFATVLFALCVVVTLHARMVADPEINESLARDEISFWSKCVRKHSDLISNNDWQGISDWRGEFINQEQLFIPRYLRL